MNRSASEHVQDGSPPAFDEVYSALRALACSRLQRTPQEHTLQATELVHEVYLKLADRPDSIWRDSDHFLAGAAVAIRWILVDRARARLAQKRGRGQRAVGLHDVADRTRHDDLELLALHDALTDLEAHDPRQAALVQLRYFAGATIQETAELLNISPATVKREWLVAKARLLLALEGNRCAEVDDA